MSKLIAIRIEDDLLVRVERERREAHLSRAAAIKEALALWIERRRYEAAVHLDQAAYRRHPVTDREFGQVLGAQTWPK